MKIREFDALMVDRPTEGVFSLSRDVYLDQELFELELEHIFEKTWLFLGHESQVPNPHDFLTTFMGRHPVVVIRDEAGTLNGFINACAHRGAVLCRTQRGNKKFLVCPYHGWTYDSGGRNVDIKDLDSGGYPDSFTTQSHDLTPIARLESYKGFIFGALNPDVRSLRDHLGQAAVFIDLMAEQSPEGMEILPGRSRYISQSNWKFQAENGVDGYHVTSVHANYLGVVQRRMQLRKDQVKSIARGDMGTMPSGAYDLGDGHTMLWGLVPGGSATRPLGERRQELETRLGETRARWMIDHSRNLGVFPNVLFMDQTSTQLRIFRPLAVDRTEITILGIAPKGESAKARNWRIRQYEDFFNATGMATPDDLTEFRACQAGAWGLRGSLQDFDRGLGRFIQGADEAAKELSAKPHASGPNWADEILFHSFYREWYRLIRDALPG